MPKTRCPQDKGTLGQNYSPLSRMDTIVARGTNLVTQATITFNRYQCLCCSINCDVLVLVIAKSRFLGWLKEDVSIMTFRVRFPLGPSERLMCDT
jgi:hypothetical protein